MGDRGLGLGGCAQQLVAHDDAREADDHQLVTDLERARVAERQRRHVGRLDAQQRQVAARHRVAPGRRAVLGDARRQAHAVLQDDRDRRLQCDAVGRRGGDRFPDEAVLDLRTIAGRQAALGQQPRQTFGAERFLDEVRGHPAARRLLRDEHHVAVGEDPAARADEETAACVRAG